MDLYNETGEFRRPLSYEKLFKLIEVLHIIWKNHAVKYPKLWRQYVLRQQDGGEKIVQILFKAAYKLVKEGSIPCLSLLAYIFVSNSSADNAELF